METSKALAIVLRELEGPALAEARAKLAQVQSEAAERIAAAEARADDLEDQLGHQLINASIGKQRLKAEYEDIIDDMWLQIKLLQEVRDHLATRLKETQATSTRPVRKTVLKGARRHGIKESATEALTHGGVNSAVHSLKRTRRPSLKRSQAAAS